MRLISWNWAAFVATYAWLRYRGLYAWSWVYLPVSSPFLLAYALAFGNEDGCAAALAPPSPLPAILATALAITWIVPPLVADRSAATREGPVPSRAGVRVGNAIGLQAFAIVIAFVAVASYDVETNRMRVGEALASLGSGKTSLAEYVASHGKLPAQIRELGNAIDSRFVSRVDMAANGTLRAVFSAAGERLAGHYIELQPQLDGNRITGWSCHTDLPDRCVPPSCRSGPQR